MIPAALRRRIPDTADRVFYMEFPDNATPEQIAMVTLRYINAMIREGAADPLVRRVTDQVVANAATPAQKVAAVHAWVQKHIRYEYDPDGIEMLTGARQAIEAALKHGRYAEDCDGMVIVEASMLSYALGARNVRTTIIKANKRAPKQWSHIYLQARVNGRWVNLDPIMNGEHAKRPKKPIGWEAPEVFERRRVDIGAGPGLDLTVQRDRARSYTRGTSMDKHDWVPAQRAKGNAMAYEDDTWFDRLPVLPDHPQPTGVGAVMSHDYAQRSIVKSGAAGLGAILSNDYEQGGVPGYRPTTTGEDPQAVTGTPYWEAPGTVGGAMRSQQGKTAAVSGIADYIQLGSLGAEGDWTAVMQNLLSTSANIVSQSQLTSINRKRMQQGLPPMSMADATAEASRQKAAAARTRNVATVGLLAAVVLGGAFWWSTRRKRR